MNAGLLLFLMHLAAVPPAPYAPWLVDFEIEDQFGGVHSREDYRGCVTVLIGADKDGSPHSEAWGRALEDVLELHPDCTCVPVLAVADVRGVPFFVKGMVRGKLPKDPRYPVLLDWDGVFAEAYAFEEGAATIVVFDAAGRVARRETVREVRGQLVHDLVREVRRRVPAVEAVHCCAG